MMQPPVEEIWSAFHEPLLRFVRRRVPDAALAEDIVQDVFLKITRHLPTLRTPEHMHGWVYQIARRAIADYYRSHPALDTLPPTVAAPEREANDPRVVVGRCLRTLIEALPPSSREALLLTDVQGLTQRELSARLGLSFSGAKARVQRGRARLKELLLTCCEVQLDHQGSPISCQSRDPYCCAPSGHDRPCCAV